MKKPNTSKSKILPILTEVFREYGYSACSLAVISKHTGLGKSSLYHFFPNGKKEMLEAVLENIEHWFTEYVFSPLLDADDPIIAIDNMLDNVTYYFKSGQKACLVGALSLNHCDDLFKQAIHQYFHLWFMAIVNLFERHQIPNSNNLAEGLLSEIQGAIIITKALGDDSIFERRMNAVRRKVAQAVRAKLPLEP